MKKERNIQIFDDRINGGMTLQALADKYGISRERIRQIVLKESRKAVRKFAKFYPGIFVRELHNLINEEHFKTTTYGRLTLEELDIIAHYWISKRKYYLPPYPDVPSDWRSYKNFDKYWPIVREYRRESDKIKCRTYILVGRINYARLIKRLYDTIGGYDTAEVI